MTTKTVRHIEPFTNEFGDVIQPGDTVYSITRCTGSTHVSKGKYLGVIKRYDYWRKGEAPYVQVEVDAKKAAYRWKDTKEDTTWNEYWKQRSTTGRGIEIYYVPYKRVSTLQLNRIVPGGVTADKLAESI